jgi:hypothetical protein
MKIRPSSDARDRLLLAGAIVAVAATAFGAVAALSAGDPAGQATESVASAPPVDISVSPAAVRRNAPATDPAGATAAALSEPRDPAITAQLEYVFDQWNVTGSDEFGYYADNDCVNFASQSLLARGWAMDEDWWYANIDGSVEHAKAWISSTSLMNYLLEHPERATPLTDADRDQVEVGDIVQFDWDDSGDRDHTGVVTSVEQDDDTTRIHYAGHTDNTLYRSVDYAITELHPGASVYYWDLG